MRHLAVILVIFCLAGSLSALFSGCEKRPEPLDRDTIKMIDTMATREIKQLRVEMDSICALKMEEYVRFYVDSLVTARLADVKGLKQE